MAATKQDVLYALLALDSYNRHDDPDKAKMLKTDSKEFSSDIGNVKFKDSSDRMEDNAAQSQGRLDGSQASGFSASYYTIGGKTLISYRGTDFGAGALEFLKDFGSGWLTSFNALNADSIDNPVTGELLQKNQPYFAREFYELVTGEKIFPTTGETALPANDNGQGECSTQNRKTR